MLCETECENFDYEKDKNLNAAMTCESAYTISKNKDLPMKTLSKIMKCDHETFLLRTSQ